MDSQLWRTARPSSLLADRRLAQCVRGWLWGRLAIWFSSFTKVKASPFRASELQVQWETMAPHDTPPHFSKWMIKSKLSGLFHANLKENLGKRFQSCFSCPQFSANDRFRSYCLFFAFRRPGKGLRRNPAHHLFPLQSRTQGSSGRHAQLLTS